MKSQESGPSKDPSRRKFMKYAGAAVGAGAVAVGLAYLERHSIFDKAVPNQPTENLATTLSSYLSNTSLASTSSTTLETPTSSKTGIVYRGKGWYGYDGDGVQGIANGIDTVKGTRWEEQEPDEPNFFAMAYDGHGNLVKGAYSNGNGEFALDDLPQAALTVNFAPCDPKDLQGNMPKILESWYKKLDPWGIGTGEVNSYYADMVKNNPSKAVYLWHRFFTVSSGGNSVLLNMRDGGKLNFSNSIINAKIEFMDGPFTLPFDNSVDVTDFQDYHHPIDTFWSGPRVLRTFFGFLFVWFHESFWVTLSLVRYSYGVR